MRKIKKNIPILYCISIFQNLYFAYCIERLYSESRGLTVSDVAMLECVYAIVVSALEVPSGWLADRFTRKSMLVASAVCSWFETIIILYGRGFTPFDAAVGIAAIGGACASSRNALLYDTLLQLNRSDQFERIYAKIALADKLSAGAAALIGSMVIAGYGLEWNYRITMVCVTATIIASVCLTEPERKMVQEPWERRILLDAIRTLKGNVPLLTILLYGAMTAAALNFIDEFWQYYFRDFGVKVFYF